MTKTLNHTFSYEKTPKDQLEDYQKNMKIFIKAIEKETSALIDKYENKIKQLNNEIARLKRELNKRNGKMDISEELSPIKPKSEILGDLKKMSSNFTDDCPIKKFLGFGSTQLQRTAYKIANFDDKFQIQSSADKLSKSRFEKQRNNKKQRQQDLLQSLQSGKINLEMSTTRMFDLLGKSKAQKISQNQQVEEKQDANYKKKKSNEKLNTSLSSICESLDNSFHGKRAQVKSQKRRQQKYAKQEQQRKKQYELQQKRKEQRIKNLLSIVRNNITASPQKPPEVIKGSKLLATGQKKKVQLTTKGKVMINPVPVDISNRSKIKQQSTIGSSPSKNLQSILKNSGNNIFSKSIENISAISFYDSGTQQ